MFFSIVLSCFIIFASSSAKKSKKWKIAMFLEIVSVFIMFNHFLCFLNHFLIMFLSFFIMFASSGAKIFQKMEKCKFPRVFFHFFDSKSRNSTFVARCNLAGWLMKLLTAIHASFDA